MGKECIKCRKEKAIQEFYKHRYMADGHLNKCAGCCRDDALLHRNQNINKVRAYDRGRGSRQSEGYLAQYRKDNPEKAKAHGRVAAAVRSGKLIPLCCEICGASKAVAHHEDYSKPLDVNWLCQAHHKQLHRDQDLTKSLAMV